MIVVDASVACKWYIDEPDCDAARSLIGARTDFIAPDLILAEFTNVAWKRLSRREISEEQATAMVDHLPYVLVDIVPCLALRQRALSIAIALDHPAYDGFYLAQPGSRWLAETAKVPRTPTRKSVPNPRPCLATRIGGTHGVVLRSASPRCR